MTESCLLQCKGVAPKQGTPGPTAVDGVGVCNPAVSLRLRAVPQGPFKYDAVPRKEIDFVPLKEEQVLNGENFIEHYQKDLQLCKFLHMIEKVRARLCPCSRPPSECS